MILARSQKATALLVAALSVWTLLPGHSQEKEATTTDAEETPPASVESAVRDTEGMVLWGALIYAVKDPEDLKKDYDHANGDLRKKLGKVFPSYKEFQMLGQTSEELFKAIHSWVAPFKEVSVFFDSKGRTKDGGIRIDLQLWRLDKAILKADAVLKVGSPVIIEGPDWGNGRLIFMLELQETQDQKRSR